jgi:hypothetical protein
MKNENVMSKKAKYLLMAAMSGGWNNGYRRKQ